MKRKGEIITCITAELIGYSAMWKYLTKHKDYQVVDNINGYTIIDDGGSLYTFPFENFHTKQELRDDKLEQLGI